MLRRVFVTACLLHAGCADVSGLADFEIAGAAGGPSGGAAGVGGDAGGAGVGGDPIVLGAFGAMAPVAAINAPQDDDDPSFTADGLELVLNSDRDGEPDIFISKRASIDDPWAEPIALAEVNSVWLDTNPVIAPDGLTLWIASNRSTTNLQIHVSTRAQRSAMFSMPSLVAELTTGNNDTVCAVTADGLLMIIGSDVNNGEHDLFVTTRAGAGDTWGTPVLLASIDALPGGNREAWLSPNGLEIYWGNGQQIWRAERAALGMPFESTEQVLELTPVGIVADPWLLPDQRYIMFSVGMSPRDIWEATR